MWWKSWSNLKSAVIRVAFGISGPTTLNRSYRELARHYDFKVDPTPARSPNKKGKVESGVKYVKNNFFKPRKDILDAGELQRQLGLWVAEIAGLRRHGTTNKRPLELFEQVERDALQPLPFSPYLKALVLEVIEDPRAAVGAPTLSVALLDVAYEFCVLELTATGATPSPLLFHISRRVLLTVERGSQQ